METKRIIIIDETIREGMQYRGVMFSSEQRMKILEFQEALQVDICQAGYPPAHEHEAKTVQALFEYADKNSYRVRVAAMGRAGVHDAKILINTGIRDLHFHLHIKNELEQGELEAILADLLKTVELVRKKTPHAAVSIAMLDMGRSDMAILEQGVSFLSRHRIDAVSLPDTSGIMSPNEVFEKISLLSPVAGESAISIHCHNDLGMASANSVMGILAGGRILEASVLGMGERNGIADLYTTAKILKGQGFEMNLRTDDSSLFREYYEYIDAIVHEQTGSRLLTFNTPVFGNAVRTHVAGTHAGGQYGLALDEVFYLNVLCGKNLVQKYLTLHHMDCPANLLEALTQSVKSESIRLNRCLAPQELQILISQINDNCSPPFS